MSCSPAVMYSVCKPWHFRKFPNQSQFMLSLPLYLQSIHDKEFKRNEHTVGSCWSVRMFTRHTSDVQHSVPNCECPSQRASTSDGFQPISSCPLPVVGSFPYIWNDQHTHEQHSKENTLPTCLCIRLACWEQKTQHFHICVIFGFERGVNEICAFSGGFYATSIDSFSPKFRNSWWWWNCHSGVGEDSSHLGLFALSTGQFTCIFSANSPRWRHYVPPKRPSPVDRA